MVELPRPSDFRWASATATSSPCALAPPIVTSTRSICLAGRTAPGCLSAYSIKTLCKACATKTRTAGLAKSAARPDRAGASLKTDAADIEVGKKYFKKSSIFSRFFKRSFIGHISPCEEKQPQGQGQGQDGLRPLRQLAHAQAS